MTNDVTHKNAKATMSVAAPLVLPCGQCLANRLMKAALSEGLATSTHGPDVRLERLYSQWGAGGYGLLITGNVMVDRLHLGEPGNVVVEDDRHVDGLSRWAATARRGGSRVWTQLNHPGRQANPFATSARPVAPSALAPDVAGAPAPRELADAEILDIIDRFAAAAAVAESAGFDGVQIHGAHGYLVSQFLSPLANRRDDRWGGILDSRLRFVLGVVRAVRGAVSDEFAVGIKLNSADFQRGGFDEFESRATIQRLAAEKVDLIEISGGSYESPAMMGHGPRESTRRREAYFLEYAQTVRSAAADIPLAVTGGFRTVTAMNEAVSSGDCDVVGLGRPAALFPAVARSIIDGDIDRLASPTISLGLPSRLAAMNSVRSLEGALDLQWHTDQLHSIGSGRAPDADRSVWRTAGTSLRRNVFDAVRSRRSRGPDVTELTSPPC